MMALVESKCLPSFTAPLHYRITSSLGAERGVQSNCKPKNEELLLAYGQVNDLTISSWPL